MNPKQKKYLFVFLFFLAFIGLINFLNIGKNISFPVIVAVGDISCGEKDRQEGALPCKDKETAKLVKTIKPYAVLALGDLQYSKGAYEDFLSFYDKTWGALKAITYPVPGNHEYRVASAEGYFDYFNGKRIFSGRVGDRDKGYYSFDLGTWHLIALNSNCNNIGGCDENSPQTRWLKRDLDNNNSICTLAFFHFPYFTSASNNINTFPNAVWDSLYQYGVDIVLTGHEHYYERHIPQDNKKNIDYNKGIRMFTVGTGGKSYAKNPYISSTAQVYKENVFGVLKLMLKPNSYAWEFIAIDNNVVDQGTARCH